MRSIVGNWATPIFDSDDASWRHGSYRTEVYERKSDNTFWRVNYRISSDGETHELREGFATIKQVWPKTVKTVVYTELEQVEPE